MPWGDKEKSFVVFGEESDTCGKFDVDIYVEPGSSFEIGIFSARVILSYYDQLLEGAEKIWTPFGVRPLLWKIEEDHASFWETAIPEEKRLTEDFPLCIEPGRYHHFGYETDGKTVRLFIDRKIVREVEIPSFPAVSSVTTVTEDEIFIKLVNMEGKTDPIEISLDCGVEREYEAVLLTGCAGSRFLNGTLDIHVELEKELAEFVGKDEALCFSTGFTVNEGIIPAVVGRGDYIICDDRDHASIVDGRRLSFATQLKYKHNDMEDLEKELQKCEPDAVKLIIVDGVFSMEGDLANLPEIVRLKKKYNASIYVDEAHGLGVFGKQGRGVCDHFGVTEDIDLIMGTFSKSLASIGGFIAGDKEVINWLRHNARSYIFQASSTPAATAAAREALHIIKSEPERIQRLWDITNYALKSFRDAGFEIGETESPIIPLYVRDTEKTFVVTKMAFDEGIFINPVIPPACAPQDTLVRVALMATHTKEQVDYAVEKLTKCFRELGIIK